MGISRRRFSTLLGGSILGSSVLSGSLISSTLLADEKAGFFASAAQTSTGQFELLVIDQQGLLKFRHPLPARSHHIEAHPKLPLLAAVGRRPETFIDIVDYQSHTLIQRIHSSAGQHFYGHAIFSPDGRYLISTENEISTGQGLIVLRDLQDNFNTVTQFSSAGIGPHELKMMPDGKTLVIANGGILTHPDKGREKLNLTSMKPSLAYIDSTSGRLEEQVFLPEKEHQLSIRHIDVNHQGRVAVALQYQGDKLDDVPLVAFHSRGKTIETVKAPTLINNAMKHYCGSIRFDRSGQTVAVSSPRGDLVTFWDQSGRFLSSARAADGCGLAATLKPGEFVISTGRGRCYVYNSMTNTKTKIPSNELGRLNWDNHLSRLI